MGYQDQETLVFHFPAFRTHVKKQSTDKRYQWQGRGGVKVTNSLGLKMHRKEKFFIGRIEKGFSFLGYQFHPGRKLRPSAESLRRLVTNARRLYEKQGDLHRLGLYVSRWTQWLWSSLPGMVSKKGGIKKYFHSYRKRCTA